MQMLPLMLMLLSNVPCEPPVCTCNTLADPRPKIQTSAAVFVGRVIGVTGRPGFTGIESPDGLPYVMDSVTVVVERSWKGTLSDTVHAPIENGFGCLTRFAPDERYLVYAGLRNGAYVIETCTRTTRLDSELAQGDLQVLGRPTIKGH
jgi:hypothetical protein